MLQCVTNDVTVENEFIASSPENKKRYLYDVCLTVAWMKEEMLQGMKEQIFPKCCVNSQSPWNNNATRRSEMTVVRVYNQE